MAPLREQIPIVLLSALLCAFLPSALGNNSIEDGSPEYDVIIVGAGLMGSVVAAKLAEALPSDSQILVLEAGKASHCALGGTEAPASALSDGQWQEWAPSLGNLTRYDVPGNYPVLQCWDQKCEQAWQDLPSFQCKILGGCGVMNGALAQVPQPGMFEGWPQGWQWEDVEEHYDAAKQILHVTQTPSADGQHYLDSAGARFVKDALSGSFSEEAPHKPRSGTMGVPFVTASDGIRQSTASELLPGALARSNFELRLESTATRIQHDQGGRAVALEYARRGVAQVARLTERGLLVLSGGALNTPRLLLDSGVAPGNAGVGKKVSDHTYEARQYKVPANSVQMTLPYPPPIGPIRTFATSRTGGLTQFGPLVTAFWRSPDTDGDDAAYDVEVWVQPSTLMSEVTLHFSLMRPRCSSADVAVNKSTGAVVFDNWSLHAACQEDRATLDGAHQAFEGWMRRHGAEPLGDVQGPFAMNHWVGSCALGRCLCPESLLVKGTENVAVADASLLPSQVWGHPALTLQAIALKAARTLASRLLERWAEGGAQSTSAPRLRR